MSNIASLEHSKMDALPKSLTATQSTVESDNEVDELCGQSSRGDTECSAIAGLPSSDNQDTRPATVAVTYCIPATVLNWLIYAINY